MNGEHSKVKNRSSCNAGQLETVTSLYINTYDQEPLYETSCRFQSDRPHLIMARAKTAINKYMILLRASTSAKIERLIEM